MVTIDAGRVFLDGTEIVAVADLPPAVETIDALSAALPMNTGPDLDLVLRADGDAPVLVINAILRTVRAAGYTGVSLCPPTPNETCRRLVLSR